MRNMKVIKGLLVWLLLFTLSACGAGKQTGTAQPGEISKLTPYYTATFTATVTPTPQGLPTSTPAPTATTTPRVYKVQPNDTLLGIANYFKISLEELKAANPGVQPALLPIVTELIIPASAAVATVVAPAPAAYTVNLLETKCVKSLTGGYHCFALVKNAEDFPLANLTAEFTLSHSAGAETLSRTLELPLKPLPAGARLPFYTYFSPPVFTDAQATARLLTMTDARDEKETTIPLVIEEANTTISADGVAATVSGKAHFAEETAATAGSYTLVGVAYDVNGQVVRLRRISAENEWSANATIDFSLSVYSTGGKIDRVEVFGEAQ